MTAAKQSKIKSIVDWASYGVLASIGSAILLKMNTALDLLNLHTVQYASLTAWAKVVAHQLGIPL